MVEWKITYDLVGDPCYYTESPMGEGWIIVYEFEDKTKTIFTTIHPTVYCGIG